MAFWIMEAEQLYQSFQGTINLLYGQFLQATYSTPWPDLERCFMFGTFFAG